MNYSREVSSGRVRRLIVKTVERCNLNCTYCYMYHHADRSYLHRPPVMSEQIFDCVLDRAAEYCQSRLGHTMALHFHGGEPMLMRPEQFDRMAQRATQILGNRLGGFSLQTNATLVDSKWIAVLQRHHVAVSVSMDGPAEVHDRSRVDHFKQGSYERVVDGLKRMAESGLAPKVLCVINPDASGSQVYRHLRSLGVSVMNFLLPDATHDSRPALYRGMKPLALSGFLSSAFDAWYTEDNPDVHVILFEELLRTLVGGVPITDAIGSAIPDYLVIDTDGSIQSNDVFKVCDEGVAESGLTVLNCGFDDDHGANEMFRALVSGQMGLPTVCKSCPEKNICGGGYLPHRYSRANGFNNPSVWCADLLAWIGHVRDVVKQDAA